MIKRLYWKKIIYGILLLGIISLFYLVYQYQSILVVGKTVEPKQADVIIILGAGVWETGPSPALRGRVKKAFEVYEEGYAPYFIVSGGLGNFPPTEAEAMRELLLEMGVEESVIFLEDQARNTFENLMFSKEIMNQQGWKSAVIVTDVFHAKRALLLAKDLDIPASGASAIDSILYTNQGLRFKFTAREVLAITKYYLSILR